MDIDAMIAAARAKIHKLIDLRCAIALGEEPSTAARRYGALYGKGGKLAKATKSGVTR